MANYTYTLPHTTKELTMDELVPIHEFYEAACTAEYILENLNETDLPEDLTDDEALQIGYDVRRKMNHYGMKEEEAINEVVSEFERDE